MSIVAADIVIYGALNIAEADGATHGGAIDNTVRYVFDDATLANTLNDTIEVLSSAAGDTTQTYTITGRNAAGGIITEGPTTLTGTTPINGVVTFERILKVVISASHTGTVTFRKASDNTTIVDVETGVLSVRRPFYDVSADAGGGSARDFYEKVFVTNNNATNAYLNARIIETSDPENQITFALETGQINPTSISTRLNVAPADVTTFDSLDKDVPDTNLHATSGIGVWLKLNLPAGDPATKTTYTIQSSGTTT